MYKNYRLHGFNGLSTRNFKDASIQIGTDSYGRHPIRKNREPATQ